MYLAEDWETMWILIRWFRQKSADLDQQRLDSAEQELNRTCNSGISLQSHVLNISPYKTKVLHELIFYLDKRSEVS